MKFDSVCHLTIKEFCISTGWTMSRNILLVYNNKKGIMLWGIIPFLLLHKKLYLVFKWSRFSLFLSSQHTNIFLSVFFPFLCFFWDYVIYLPIPFKGSTRLVWYVTHEYITKSNFTIQDNRIITCKTNTLLGFFVFHLPILQKG